MFRRQSGIYVPRHTIIESIEPAIRITTAYIPDHHINPLRVHRMKGCTLLVEHIGTLAADIIPRFISDLYHQEKQPFFALWSPYSVEEIEADWPTVLTDLLWMRSTPENIPHQAKWE